jgi:hypothetical protein
VARKSIAAHVHQNRGGRFVDVGASAWWGRSRAVVRG